MRRRFFSTVFTPSVQAEQARHGSLRAYARLAAGGDEADGLGPGEVAFIGARDSFYLATVSETGWPHVQHRGGPPGFLHVLDGRTLAWADFSGNRQYVSIGNAAVNDRVAMILMDYPAQARLKILGHLTAVEIVERPDLAELLATPGYGARIEHALVVRVEAFDWNCPQHIMPRFTAAEIAEGMAPRDRDR